MFGKWKSKGFVCIKKTEIKRCLKEGTRNGIIQRHMLWTQDDR